MTDQEKELEFYKKKFSVAEHDIAVSGYLAYVGVVKQQVEYVKEFKITSNIDGKKTDTVVYERSIALWESLPDMISKMNRLKTELGIEYNPDEGKPKQQATRPELMASNPQ